MVEQVKRLTNEELEAHVKDMAEFCMERFGTDFASAVTALTELVAEYVKLAHSTEAGYATVCTMLRCFLQIKTNRFIFDTREQKPN